jgi:endonuclease/exonuclease/phosphatase family metal-dependent hydrolase
VLFIRRRGGQIFRRFMKKLPVLLILLFLLAAAFLLWRESSLRAPETPEQPVAEESTPTPQPTPPATPLPEPPVSPEPTATPQARTAPEGMVYVLQRFSESSSDGVRGFSPGMEVRLVREESGHYVVSDGVVESRQPSSSFTRDVALAEELRAQKKLTDAEIKRRQAEAQAAYEQRQKESAARWQAAVEASNRQPAATPAPARPKLAPLRLGAWNLEAFGHRDDPPRSEDDLQAVADFIRGLGVQVLALSEINGEKPLKDLCARLGPNWKYAVGTSGILPDGIGARVAPGLLWDDARVEMISAGELSELRKRTPTGPIFHREPISACFRDRAGGPDFRVVAVHLKAGRDEDSVSRREAEMAGLRDYLESLLTDKNEDNDIVVLGDFNLSAEEPASEILAGDGFARFLKGRGRSIIHFNSQIDHIVPLTSFEEIEAGSFEIHNDGMRDAREWRERYSDHFPVTIDLQAVPDDDPQATLSSSGSRLR